MSRALRILLVFAIVGLYTLLAPFGYGAFAALQAVPARDRRARARLLQGVMRRAFTLMHDTLRWCGLLDYDPRTIRASLYDGPSVLVCNHPCLCDVTSLMAAVPDLTTAVKPALFRRRWFRPLLEGAMLFEGVGEHFHPEHVVDAAVDRIAQGFRVLIFPEGTRSPEGKLLPFGRTAFEIACRANVPVVPLVLHLEPPWLTKEHGVFNPPNRTSGLKIEALSPVYPSEAGFSSRTLRDVISAQIRERLGAAAVGTPPPTDDTHARTVAGNPDQEADRRVVDARGHQA